MDGTRGLIILLTIFIIMFLLIGIIFIIYGPLHHSINPLTFVEPYQGYAVWGNAQLGPDSARNTCKLYQFQAALEGGDQTCGYSMAIPGIPSLDPAVLATKTPMSQQGCYDVDQIVAIEATHQCTTSTVEGSSKFSPANAFCVGNNGVEHAVGQSEVYFTNQLTLITNGTNTNINCNAFACSGTLALYAINYAVTDENNQPSPPVCNGIQCIRSNEDGTFSLVNCDITDANQLMRVTRAPINTSLASSGSMNGKTGLLASILSRVDNKCIVPNAALTGVTTGGCGAVWGLFDQITGTQAIAPQQTVYIGALTADDFAMIIAAASDPDKLLAVLASLNLKSLRISGGELILAPFFVYLIPNPELARFSYTSQYIDYTLYNDILFSTTFFGFGP